MNCYGCGEEKLSNEFPSMKITPICDHPRFHCMRCVVKHVKEFKKCPFNGCGVEVNPDSEIIQLLQATLDEMFREYTCEYEGTVSARRNIVRVAIMTGDAVVLEYRPDLTIRKLKSTVKDRMNHDLSKQKLVHNQKTLEEFGRSHKELTLEDYNIGPDSTIHLLVLLYAIPNDLDHVIFDLHWGYPAGPSDEEIDYLDASCFAFSQSYYVSVCDFMYESKGASEGKTRFNALRHCRTDKECDKAIRHSGDHMDDSKRRGHHTIEVYMKKIPENITHLIFTLSAFKAPAVSKFPTPTLQFFEASNRNADLCSTSFDKPINSRAIIMCYVAKDEYGKWQIYECGVESDGCAAGYLKLVATIKKNMKRGLLF